MADYLGTHDFSAATVIGAGGGGLTWGDSITDTSGTGITTTIGASAAASTIGQSIVIDNTQTGASVMQKIDLGTSAQGHTGLLIKAYNASSLASGVTVDPSTTCTGYGYQILNNGGSGFIGIRWNANINTDGGTRYGIRQANMNTSTGTGYGIYQTGISTSSGAGYGLYQNLISSSTGNAYGWYVNNLESSGQGGNARFFSLNSTHGTYLPSRTTDMSEIVVSRSQNSATTNSDDYNVLNIKRSNISNNASATFNAVGSVLSVENVATQTAGTLNDSVPVLKLTQDNNSTGGHILMNSYTGTPTTDGTLYFDGSDLKMRIGGTTYTFTKT